MPDSNFDRGPVAGVYFESGETEALDQKKRRRVQTNAGGVRYIMLEMNLALEINPLLTPTQHRIVALILGDYREDAPWARFTATEICELLDIAQPNFYRAVKPLRDAGLVIKQSTTMWQVNPHYGWRGSRKSWEAAMKAVKPPNLEVLGG